MFYNTARKGGLKSGDDKEAIKRMYKLCPTCYRSFKSRSRDNSDQLAAQYTMKQLC